MNKKKEFLKLRKKFALEKQRRKFKIPLILWIVLYCKNKGMITYHDFQKFKLLYKDNDFVYLSIKKN